MAKNKIAKKWAQKKEKHGARKTKICAYLCDNFVAKNKSAKAEPSKLGDVLVRSEVNLKN